DGGARAARATVRSEVGPRSDVSDRALDAADRRADRERYARWTAGALLVVTLGVQIAAFRGAAMDDAFITFRYAQNLAEGLGPVFNTDQRVLGTTAPGQMLIAAAMYAFFGQDALPSIMAALGCIARTAQALAVFLLLQPEL